MIIESSLDVRSTWDVAAPVPTVTALVGTPVRWPQLVGAVVHSETLRESKADALLRHWVLIDDRSVRVDDCWWSYDPVRTAFTVRYPSETASSAGSPEQRIARVSAEALPSGSTRLRLAVERSASDTADDPAAGMFAWLEDLLGSLARAAEYAEEIDRLVISFEDRLFMAGDIADAYDYLNEADKWPQRIPHVSGLRLEENVPGIQFFDMDTKTLDGSSHQTRSVRICLRPTKIVYKQIRLPVLLDAHTGHWTFTSTPEGIVAGARHTATIKPNALSVLGEETTVADARKYLRRVLSANSMSNLRLAKEFSESRAGL